MDEWEVAARRGDRGSDWVWGAWPGVRTKPPPFYMAPSSPAEGAAPPHQNHVAVWAARVWGPGQGGHSEHGEQAEDESGRARPQGHGRQSVEQAEWTEEGPGWTRRLGHG